MQLQTHVFAIVSWGCAATAWVARALNSHTDILCLHASNHVWPRGRAAAALDGVDYLAVLANLGAWYGAVGDIHGISREAVPAARAALGDGFSCAVLVRDPWARYRSQIALFERCNYEGWGALDYVRDVAAVHGDNPDTLSRVERHLIHAASCLNAIVAEAKLGPVFRCEDVTRDTRALCRLARTVTAERFSIDERWAERALAIEQVNTHVRGNGPPGHDERAQQILTRYVTPEAWDIYRRLGYAPLER